jgi:gliding motility-associated-like protein
MQTFFIGVLLALLYQPTNPWFTAPASFSPNNDGVEDTWQLNWKSQPDSIQIGIFNRWGQQIFASKQTNFSWNGQQGKKRCAAGQYFYTISVFNNTKQQYTGSVTLLR